MKKIIPTEWKYLGRWIQPALHGYLWIHWGETRAFKALEPSLTSNILILDGHFFLWLKDYEILYQRSRQAVANENWQFFSDFTVLCHKAKEKLLALEARSRTVSQGQDQLLLEFLDTLLEMTGPWTAILPIADGLEEEFMKLAKQGGRDFEQLLRPSIKPWIVEEHQAMRKLLEQIEQKKLLSLLDLPVSHILEAIKKQDSQLAQGISAHMQKYEWLGTHHFWGSGMTEASFFKAMKQEPMSQQVASEKPLVGFSAREKMIISYTQELIFWRLHCAEVVDRVAYSYRSIMRQLEKKYGYRSEDFYWLTLPELRELLVDHNKVSLSQIDERKKSYGITHLSGDEQVLTGPSVLQLLQTLKKDSSLEGISTISGMTGSGGRVQGRVRILLSPNDIHLFKKGEVLVAPETTPDFITAMKMACAFVTDVGGITSHAAIIARELKKPCIIGTKVATRVLKDGDLVEVDASKGVVTILKRR